MGVAQNEVAIPTVCTTRASDPYSCDIKHEFKKGGMAVISVRNTKNANYLCIVAVLKELLHSGVISQKEYAKAKKYYLKLTGADIVLAN